MENFFIKSDCVHSPMFSSALDSPPFSPMCPPFTYTDFLSRAKKNSILISKKERLNGWFSEPIPSSLWTSSSLSATYLLLFNCLVDVHIITTQVTHSFSMYRQKSYVLSSSISFDPYSIEWHLQLNKKDIYRKINETYDIDFLQLSRILYSFCQN